MRMRIGWCVVAVMLACAANVSAQESPLAPVMVGYSASEAALLQTTPVATAVNSLRWEHNTVDLTSAAVVRFELCYDTASPCPTITTTASAFTPTSAQGGPPAAGNSAFKMLLPALTPGNHTVTVKACNTELCGDASTPFAFTFVVKPGVPTALGLIPGGGGD